MKVENGFKLRRSDVINIIVGIIYLSTLIWGIAAVKASVDLNTEWRIQHAKLPACVERIEAWITDNKELPNDVLTLKLDLKYLAKDIQHLTDQLKITNEHLNSFNEMVNN